MEPKAKTAALHSRAVKSTDPEDINIKSDTAASSDSDDSTERKQLLSRIAVAGVVILGLIGGLAIFEVFNRTQETAMPQMALHPGSRAIEMSERNPVSEQGVEKPIEDQGEIKSHASNQEIESMERVKEEGQQHPPATKQLTTPAYPQSASIKRSNPASSAGTDSSAMEQSIALPEHTTGLTTKLSRSSTHTINVAPKTQPSGSNSPNPSVSATGTQTPGHGRNPSSENMFAAKRFLIQLGVFSKVGNAEDLISKLRDAGIPAQLEWRVQVGPFPTRTEADAAQQKLKAMGYDESLLVRR